MFLIFIEFLHAIRHHVRRAIGKQLSAMEHFIYGVTYLLIGFTELHALYYMFGAFVFVTIAFGDNGGEI